MDRQTAEKIFSLFFRGIFLVCMASSCFAEENVPYCYDPQSRSPAAFPKLSKSLDDEIPMPQNVCERGVSESSCYNKVRTDTDFLRQDLEFYDPKPPGVTHVVKTCGVNGRFDPYAYELLSLSAPKMFNRETPPCPPDSRGGWYEKDYRKMPTSKILAEAARITEEEALRILYLASRFGVVALDAKRADRPADTKNNEQVKPWSIKSLDAMIRSLGSMPKMLFPVPGEGESVIRTYRVPRDVIEEMDKSESQGLPPPPSKMHDLRDESGNSVYGESYKQQTIEYEKQAQELVKKMSENGDGTWTSKTSSSSRRETLGYYNTKSKELFFADDLTDKELPCVTIHEFAHFFDYNLSTKIKNLGFQNIEKGIRGYSDSEEWNLANTLKPSPKQSSEFVNVMSIKNKFCMPSEYALTSTSENFAESLAEWILQPERAAKCPEKKAFFEKIFHLKSSSGCSDESTLTQARVDRAEMFKSAVIECAKMMKDQSRSGFVAGVSHQTERCLKNAYERRMYASLLKKPKAYYSGEMSTTENAAFWTTVKNFQKTFSSEYNRNNEFFDSALKLHRKFNLMEHVFILSNGFEFLREIWKYELTPRSEEKHVRKMEDFLFGRIRKAKNPDDCTLSHFDTRGLSRALNLPKNSVFGIVQNGSQWGAIRRGAPRFPISFGPRQLTDCKEGENLSPKERELDNTAVNCTIEAVAFNIESTYRSRDKESKESAVSFAVFSNFVQRVCMERLGLLKESKERGFSVSDEKNKIFLEAKTRGFELPKVTSNPVSHYHYEIPEHVFIKDPLLETAILRALIGQQSGPDKYHLSSKEEGMSQTKSKPLTD